MGLLSARFQESSGMGTPMVPQRRSTLLPTELRTRATAVCTRGAWQRRSSVSLKKTPERLSGSAHRRRVSTNATADDGVFWNCTRSNRRQSHTQGLSWRPLNTNKIIKVTQYFIKKITEYILQRATFMSPCSILHGDCYHILAIFILQHQRI